LRSDFFQSKYGLIPEFKAGMHTGQVTTGEIGTLKKEIVYSGDVLNVSARIQGLCNEYNADMLLSYHLFKKLKLENVDFEKIGNLPLKGKKRMIDIIKLKGG
jgi:adenylate cyclase